MSLPGGIGLLGRVTQRRREIILRCGERMMIFATRERHNNSPREYRNQAKHKQNLNEGKAQSKLAIP